ncbi:LysR family transcriptional regulator [Candidatus Pelagibacter ubique]|nr:LysR family transcriptional regulator [Candidatus Pelagibacter ubique]
MNLWHLKVFNEIMLSGTVSQAAKNLKRTQSSISAALSNLEKGIGYDLFVRKNRRLHPVPEAYFLKEESKNILQQMEDLDQILIQKKETGSELIKISSIPLLAELLIPNTISKFKKKSPHSNFFVSSVQSSTVYQEISTQTFDIGIAELQNKKALVNQKEYHCECICVLFSGDPLSKKKIITPRDLSKKKCVSFQPNHFITKNLINIFEKNKAIFNPHYQFQNAGTSCVSIVNNSDTYSVISPISFWLINKFNLDTSKIVFRRLSSTIPYSFGILTPAHQPMSQIAKSFLNYLEIGIENMLGEIDKKGVLFKI